MRFWLQAQVLAVLIASLAPIHSARAEPVKGWSFTDWSASPEQVKESALGAGLSVIPASAEDAAMYRLPDSEVPFAIPAEIYGRAAKAFPIFRDNGLEAVRFVVKEPGAACKAVLDGLTADFGPGSKDERGFANVNWPTTAKFGLTVVVTPYFCWPLFSRPGS
jgi:hypothetical protein